MTPISRRQLITRAAAVATTGAGAFVGNALAQPAGRPITLVVPTPAGGTTDITARLLAEPLGKLLGTSVVVDNRAGGNGSIGGQLVARGPLDGTSLLVQYSGYQCISPLLQSTAGFDPAKDLRPIAHLVDAPQLMAVRANFPADSFVEFLKYVKANPGKVNYASSGNGSLQHMTTELLKDLTKTFMVHIPYRGTGQAMTDLLGGAVDFTITTPPPLMPHIRAGKLKALMVTGRSRLSVLPNVPTALESGVALVASSWFGLYGPSGMSPELASRISSAVKQVVESDHYKKRIEEQGAKALFLDGADLGKLASAERNMWGRIIKLSGIKAD